MIVEMGESTRVSICYCYVLNQIYPFSKREHNATQSVDPGREVKVDHFHNNNRYNARAIIFQSPSLRH